MSKVLAFLTIHKTHTSIKLDNSLDLEQRKLLVEFVSSKNGAFVDESYKELLIPRILKQDHIQKLFNLHNIDITVIGADTQSKSESEKFEDIRKICENHNNSYKLSFGQFKGHLIQELPEYYLKYLAESHSEFKLVDMCKKELKNRDTITFY